MNALSIVQAGDRMASFFCVHKIGSYARWQRTLYAEFASVQSLQLDNTNLRSAQADIELVR